MYCSKVAGTNVSGASIDWAITLTVDETLTTTRETIQGSDGGEVTFEGVLGSDVLAPEEVANIGFCANRQP